MDTLTRDADLDQRVKPLVLTVRLIVVGLVVGVFAMTGAVIWVRSQPDFKIAEDAGDIFLPMAVLFAVASVAGSQIVSGILVRFFRRHYARGSAVLPPGATSQHARLIELGVPGRLALLYQTQAIFSATVLEGGAIFGVMAYLVTGRAVVLLLSAALVAMLLLLFPTRSRVLNWVDRQLQLIEELQQFSR